MKQGWQIKKLGELCNLMTGGTPSRSRPEYFDQGTIKWLVSGDIHKKEIFDCEGRITKDAMKNSNAKFLPVNSVIIALNGQGKTRGTVALLRTKATCNQSLVSIYPKDVNKILPEYIFCNLHGRYDEIRKITGDDGNDRRGLNMSLIKDIEIPLPSLHEQQRIVAVLDRASAAISKAKDNSEQNLKNAKELFESCLQGMFENPGDGWEEKPFEEVCKLVGGSQPSKENFIYHSKEGYIRLIQVRDYKTDKYCTYIPQIKAKRFCSKNDIMIGRYGPPIFGIFKGLEGAYNVALMKAEVNSKICNPDYFYWFLKNNKLRKFVEKSSKRAAGQDGVRKELLDKYPVPLPKLAEQRMIANKLATVLIEAKKLEDVYHKKLHSLEELKNSILQKAFSGELIIHEVCYD